MITMLKHRYQRLTNLPEGRDLKPTRKFDEVFETICRITGNPRDQRLHFPRRPSRTTRRNRIHRRNWRHRCNRRNGCHWKHRCNRRYWGGWRHRCNWGYRGNRRRGRYRQHRCKRQHWRKRKIDWRHRYCRTVPLNQPQPAITPIRIIYAVLQNAT